MAEMKSLSQNSTKSLRLLLADKNRAPLKADSVHVKGYVYTQERNSNIVKVKHEFELNKGVTTGCEIKNDMLYLDDMAENFPVGQFRIYTQTFLPDTMTGKEYITENDQPLFVQVVAKGSFITDRQGAMYDFVFLPIEIGNAAQAPFVPAGADEQWIKDFLKTFVTTPAFKQIVNYGLRIQASQMPCAFSLYKIYSKVDLTRLAGRTIDMSVELMNKQGAMRLVMMGYKGSDPTASPKLLSFSNSQPQYNAGWEEIDNMFIAENTLSDKHKETKTFTFPTVDDGYSACAFLLRPETEAVPVDVTIFDMEGDIKPGFVFATIKEKYLPGQMTLMQQDMFTKSAIMCPIGDEAYRYTIGATETKIPVGIFKDNGFVKNNNAWYDAGSSGKELQGDMEVLKSFRGSLSYSLNIYNEQATDSNVTVWLARVETDGSFTKIPESELTVTVKANTTPTAANEITLPSFSHNYKKGESYRWFAQADKADGAYIQCNNGSHIPMVEIILDVEYYTEIPEDVLRENGVLNIKLMDGDTEVKDVENYTVQIDVKTGTIKVTKK